jgi:ketosteroid isomerase-like protein
MKSLKYNFKNLRCSFASSICLLILLFGSGCNKPIKDESKTVSDSTAKTYVPNLAKVKMEIQTLENDRAKAVNAQDLNSIIEFYSDDAILMLNGAPMLIGKNAILLELEKSISKQPKGNIVAYDVMEIYGDENTVTETGKSSMSDSEGNLVSTGKYMAVWEKRDGKYVCVRHINNQDGMGK